MNPLSYQDGVLLIEGCSARELAQQYGTPLFVYSATALREGYKELADCLAEVAPLICYSVKANSNRAVIALLQEQGAGADIVSGGELVRARRAGISADRIVFAGVGKTVPEIDAALTEGILFFSVESEAEAERISQRAVALNRTGRIAFRVNPDVDPQTHKYVSTGQKESKFGLDIERTLRAYEAAARLPNLELAGLHMHIGSQILTPAPFVHALQKVIPLCRQLQQTYPDFRWLDIGGGLGIRYRREDEPLSPAVFAAAVLPLLRECGLKLVMEPGRYLTGNAGILLTEIQYVKENPFRKFLVADAAMNDLIRPALYHSWHDVVPVAETTSTVLADLVGPICESGDFLATERELPDVKQGELLAVKSAGAYGFTMSSNYNSRPRAAEIMVDGSRAHVVRRRETIEDLIRQEEEL